MYSLVSGVVALLLLFVGTLALVEFVIFVAWLRFMHRITKQMVLKSHCIVLSAGEKDNQTVNLLILRSQTISH